MSKIRGMSISVDVHWKAALLFLPTEEKGWAYWTANTVGPEERIVLRQQFHLYNSYWAHPVPLKLFLWPLTESKLKLRSYLRVGEQKKVEMGCCKDTWLIKGDWNIGGFSNNDVLPGKSEPEIWSPWCFLMLFGVHGGAWTHSWEPTHVQLLVM